MKNFSLFQVIIIAIFGFAGIIAVLVFSGFLPGYNGGGDNVVKTTVVMWGALPEKKIKPIISLVNEDKSAPFKINYFEKNPASYENELVNALASGKGPDFLIITQDMVLKNKDRIFFIPFTSYPERNFKDDFINLAELLIDAPAAAGGGVIGIPLLVNPLVLYWNKDLFSSAGISRPPQYWDEEFLEDIEELTIINEAKNITQAGIALGEFTNIRNAKDILSMLILQSGNPIIKSDVLDVVLDEGGSAAADAVKFFNEFSNPSKRIYSWNKSLPASDSMFIKNSLGMYFDYASETGNTRARNPHLSFDIAEPPQMKDGKIKATFGKMYSLAILKNSPNKAAAFAAIMALAGKDASKTLSESVNMGSARRDVLSGKAPTSELALIYKTAVMSRAWLEPDAEEVYVIFKDMIEFSASGRVSVSEAVKLAKNRFEKLLNDVLGE